MKDPDSGNAEKKFTELELGSRKRGSDLEPDFGDDSPLLSFLLAEASSACPFVIFGEPESSLGAADAGPLGLPLRC